MSDDGSIHSLRSSSPALSENTHSLPHRYLGLCIPITQTALIPPEFDPNGKAVEALQREHHDAMTHWGYSETGTIFTSVRFQLSKSVHVLQTTLAPFHAQHYEHLLATAIHRWAENNQRGTTPVGPSFNHSHYGAVIGRNGQTIRSISAEAKLVWDASNPLAGLYVVCVKTPSDEIAAKCHQLRARLDTQAIRIGLSTAHPFGGSDQPTESTPPPGIVLFDVEPRLANTDIEAALTRAFAAHTEELVRSAPRTYRSQWLLEVPATAKIFPPFESSIVAAELLDGVVTVAVARKNWQRCRDIVTNALV